MDETKHIGWKTNTRHGSIYRYMEQMQVFQHKWKKRWVDGVKKGWNEARMVHWLRYFGGGGAETGRNGRNTALLGGKPIQDRYIDIWMKYWWGEMDDWRGGKERWMDVRHLDLRHFGTNAGFSSVNGRKDEWLVWKNLDGGMQKLVDETNGRNNGRDGTAILDQ